MSSGIWLVREIGLNFWEGGEGVWLIYDGLAFHPYMGAKLLATLYHRNWEKLSGLMRQLTGEQTFPLKPFSWIVKFNFYDKTFVISRVLYKYCVNVVHLYSQVEMMTFSAQSSVN